MLFKKLHQLNTKIKLKITLTRIIKSSQKAMIHLVNLRQRNLIDAKTFNKMLDSLIGNSKNTNSHMSKQSVIGVNGINKLCKKLKRNPNCYTADHAGEIMVQNLWLLHVDTKFVPYIHKKNKKYKLAISLKKSITVPLNNKQTGKITTDVYHKDMMKAIKKLPNSLNNNSVKIIKSLISKISNNSTCMTPKQVQHAIDDTIGVKTMEDDPNE